MTQQRELYLQLTPRDPVIARDGRPFSAGVRMKSLDWIYPSVAAGSVRTLVGLIRDKGFEEDTVALLLQNDIAGVFPSIEEELYFPAPLDAVARPVFSKTDESYELYCVRPASINGGADFPDRALQPSVLPDLDEDFKPARIPAFWSMSRFTDWLLDPALDSMHRCKAFGLTDQPFREWPSGFRNLPHKDRRMHVQIDPNTQAAKDQMLFQTVGLDVECMPTPKTASLPTDIRLSMRVAASPEVARIIEKLDDVGPLGGERRIVHWGHLEQEPNGWNCHASLQAALREARYVRMILASPAIFSDAWKAGWMTQGTPPGTEGLTLKLISACTGRWLPLSGWSLVAPRGPKQMQRLVPAGSVYFFEVVKGKADSLVGRWMRSVCDDAQHGLDGFGLATWGIWSPRS